MLGISPNQPSIKEGEFFKAELCAIGVSNPLPDSMRFFVNETPLEVKNGIAIFKKQYNKAGIYHIKGRLETYNYFLKQRQSFNKEYYFEVLPK
jgi:hypothetical protein